jgi:cytochrome P450
MPNLIRMPAVVAIYLLVSASAFSPFRGGRYLPALTSSFVHQHPQSLKSPTRAPSTPNRALLNVATSEVPPPSNDHSSNRIRQLFSAFAALWKALARFTSQRILWPNSAPDASVSAPLPPSTMGCPLFGHNIMAGSKHHGPFVFFANAAKTLGNPKIFRYFAFGMPFVSVSGKDNIKATLKGEFDPDGINTMSVSEGMSLVFGTESILYQNDKTKHALLRRLAGQAMTPVALRKAVPTIQATAEEVIDKYFLNAGGESSITMENMMDAYTMNIARKQILGLEIEEDELETFEKNTSDWINGIFNPLLMIPGIPKFVARSTKGGRARDYLVSKLEERLEYLATLNESDGSSLGAMFFAVDEDGNKLSREQLIDNALILILAGTETSSSTLTVASLLLGLHPDIYQRLREEQQALQAKHGDAMTMELLDEECPYLDAVIRETMRMKPVDGLVERKTEKTLVVDGTQIPQKYLVYVNLRQTHADDPKTFLEDGSHMDIYKGFNPDRWLDDETKPSEWMGFGEGQRRCLGERLAMCEMKIFLASLARKVDEYALVNGGDKILWKPFSVMARPSDGVEVVLK